MSKNEKENEKESEVRHREPRKKTYERALRTTLPAELVEHFRKDDWFLSLRRFRLGGQIEHTHISSLEEEGWLLVTIDEIPDRFKSFFIQEDFRAGRKQALIRADLVLMKADVDLVKSKDDYYKEVARRELEAVDMNVLQKKGFQDLGSTTKTTMSEPRFK